MTPDDVTFQLTDTTSQKELDVRELICCEMIRLAGYAIMPCTPATGTLFITDDHEFASNQLVKSVSGNKLVEPISCGKYLINELKACSFLYFGTDKDGKRYGVLTVVVVDIDKSNNMISYRADPLNFDKEQSTMDHIIGSYKLLKD